MRWGAPCSGMKPTPKYCPLSAPYLKNGSAPEGQTPPWAPDIPRGASFSWAWLGMRPTFARIKTADQRRTRPCASLKARQRLTYLKSEGKWNNKEPFNAEHTIQLRKSGRP